MALTPEQLAKLTNLEQLQLLAQRTNAKFVALDNEVVKSVGLEKDATATAGYAASYTLSVNGTALPTKIDIPKDWLLSGVTKGTVTAEDKAAGGKFENDDDFAVGDKYIDFSFNVKSGGTETTTHIYLNVQDLVDAYLAGNGLALDSSTNTFSVVVDSANANGLSVGANGLAMATAIASTSGVGGSNGAMTAADKEKLDGMVFATNAEVTAMLDDVLPAPTSN